MGAGSRGRHQGRFAQSSLHFPKAGTGPRAQLLFPAWKMHQGAASAFQGPAGHKMWLGTAAAPRAGPVGHRGSEELDQTFQQ